MKLPITINKPKVLIVEGNDDELLINEILSFLDLSDFQVCNCGGKTLTATIIRTISATPGFSSVNSLGIIVDADRDADATFDSVCGSLGAAGLPRPPHPLTLAHGHPNTAAIILPHGSHSGVLEDVCLKSVQTYPEILCIDGLFDCVETRKGSLPTKLSKAKVQVYLACQSNPCPHLGVGAQMGYWPLADSAYDDIRRFLTLL